MNIKGAANMKKGFTLIELLAVIVILGVIALIVTSSVTGIMNKSKKSLSLTQIKTFEDAASKWGTLNADKMPTSNGDYIDVDLSTLDSDGYIDSSELNDPSNNKKICGFVRITYKDDSNIKNTYTYEFNKKSC